MKLGKVNQEFVITQIGLLNDEIDHLTKVLISEHTKREAVIEEFVHIVGTIRAIEGKIESKTGELQAYKNIDVNMEPIPETVAHVAPEQGKPEPTENLMDQAEEILRQEKPIHTQLQERTANHESELQRQAREMAEKANKNNTPWTDEEKDVLRQYYPTNSAKTLSKLFKRTPGAINAEAMILGVGKLGRKPRRKQ